MIVKSTFSPEQTNLLPNSSYWIIYLWWETEGENRSWSLLGVKGLMPIIDNASTTASHGKQEGVKHDMGENECTSQ